MLTADVEVRDNLVNSDHGVIMFAINYRNKRHVGRTSTLNFKRVNFNKLCSLLYRTKWEQQRKHNKRECFKDILNNSISLGNKYKRSEVKSK